MSTSKKVRLTEVLARAAKGKGAALGEAIRGKKEPDEVKQAILADAEFRKLTVDYVRDMAAGYCEKHL